MIKNKYYFTYTNYLTFKSENKQNNFKKITPEKFFKPPKHLKNLLKVHQLLRVQ